MQNWPTPGPNYCIYISFITGFNGRRRPYSTLSNDPLLVFVFFINTGALPQTTICSMMAVSVIRHLSATTNSTVKLLISVRVGGNKFQTCLRPSCYWRQALIRGPTVIRSFTGVGGTKFLISARAVKYFRLALDPAPIRGRLLLEVRRLLKVYRI